jgi:hypothetical protein
MASLVIRDPEFCKLLLCHFLYWASFLKNPIIVQTAVVQPVIMTILHVGIRKKGQWILRSLYFIPLKENSWEACNFPLSSHWSELNHIAPLSCMKDRKMSLYSWAHCLPSLWGKSEKKNGKWILQVLHLYPHSIFLERGLIQHKIPKKFRVFPAI